MLLVDEFENGEVNFKKYDIYGHTRYWLRVGQALLELTPTNLEELWVLLDAYVKGEEHEEA